MRFLSLLALLLFAIAPVLHADEAADKNEIHDSTAIFCVSRDHSTVPSSSADIAQSPDSRERL